MVDPAPRRMPAFARVGALAAVTLTLASLAGCSSMLSPLATRVAPVRGEGEVIAQDRTSGDFQRLSVGGGLAVVASTGSPASVTLSAQPNLLPLVTTEVRDGQLIVNVSPPGFSATRPVTLTVVAPELRSITLSGGTTGALELVGMDLAIDLSGGAVLQATGRAESLAVTASGGARAKLGELAATSASVDLSGGAEAELDVTDSVDGTASGGATVRLTRQPASVDVTTSSGATVQGS